MMRNQSLFACMFAAMAFLSGCSTPQGTVALAASGVIVAGAQAPTHELEQIYYLGVFDPEEQVPSTIYRLTVRGQSSFLNSTHFASGWVPAMVLDSLNGHVSADPNSNSPISVSAGDAAGQSRLNYGRRLVMFGPEGFREAPADHRLVIVMGSDPSKFFDAIDDALGDISSVTIERNNSGVRQKLAMAFQTVHNSHENLQQFQLEVADELPKQGK